MWCCDCFDQIIDDFGALLVAGFRDLLKLLLCVLVGVFFSFLVAALLLCKSARQLARAGGGRIPQTRTS